MPVNRSGANDQVFIPFRETPGIAQHVGVEHLQEESYQNQIIGRHVYESY